MNLKANQTLLLLFSLGMSSLLIAEPLSTDRPGASETTSFVAPGFAQIEGGIKTFEDSNSETGTEYGGAIIRFGLAEDWELRLGWGGYLDSDSASGANDGSLGFKYSINSESDSIAQPEMALVVQTTVPFGDSDISSERFDPTVTLACSHTLTDEFSLGYNLGLGLETVEKANGGRTTQSSGIYTLVLGYSATEQLSAFAEVYGQVGFSADDSPFLFDCGLAYLLNDNSQLDVSAGVGLNSAAEDFFVSIGYSFRWGMENGEE